ncbi:MAG: PD-(D/E)XK nuclease family protein, partial [Gammaproteobacteria bacterium]
SCRQVIKAISNTLGDNRGRWILSADHSETSSELPLAGVIDNQAIHVVLDRSFIDEHGTRWVIDFKTGTHSGADLQGFLDREMDRYNAQLGRYAQLMAALEPAQPVRVALYYPMLSEWREWDPLTSIED